MSQPLRSLRYRYRAFTASGAMEEGIIEARSSTDAFDAIWGKGLTPLEARPEDGDEKTPWWKREITFGGGGPNRQAIAYFTRELAILCKAGIPLDDVLRILSGQSASAPMRQVCKAILADVLDGAPLSDALERHPGTFGPDYVSIVRAGEASGDIGRPLAELASLLERRLELMGKLKSALVYPAVLVVMALVSIGVIVNVLIPSVAPIFVQNGKEFPFLIGQVVALQANWQVAALAVAAIAALLALVTITALRTPAIRLRLDRLLLRLPVTGSLLLQREIARFSRTLGTLLHADVPILPAFTAGREVVANRYLRRELADTLDKLRDGAGLAKALGELELLPPVVHQLIAIGEEAGQLNHMLIRLAENLESQEQRRIDTFMTILTPALTLFIAGLVGSLIFSVMSAILSINDLAI